MKIVWLSCPGCHGAIPRSPWPEDQCTVCHGDLAYMMDYEKIAERLLATKLTDLALKHEGK